MRTRQSQQSELLKQQQAQEKVINLANKFDKLPLAGYEEILKFAAEKVNAECVEATRHKWKPQRQAVIVTRWDAMRELLDAIRGYVDETMRERDEILDPPKPEEELVNAGN